MELTDAQREILPLLAADLTTAEIGRELDKAEQTIRAHLARAYARNAWHGPHAAVLAFVAEGGKPARITKRKRQAIHAGTLGAADGRRREREAAAVKRPKRRVSARSA